MRKSICGILWMTAAILFTVVGTGCSAKMKASYHLHRAQRYFDAGQYQEASIEYQKVLRSAPHNAEAWSRLGIIYFDEGRPLEAAPILVRAAELDTNNVEVRLKLGNIYLGLGKVKEARGEAKFVLDRKPHDHQAPLLLAEASVTTNEITTARQRLQTLYQTGETAPLDVALGILAFHQGNLKTAETFYRLATVRNPKFSDAYSALGNLYALRKDLKSADRALKTAARLAPVWSGKGVQYARFKILTGDSAAGKQVLQDLTKKDPGYLPAWLALAQVATDETNYIEGLTLLGNVLSRDPRNLEGLLLKARLELLQGKTAQAVKELEQTAKMYPEVPSVLYRLAAAYLANRESDQAVNKLNQALNLDPKLVQATLLLARIQIQNGNAGSAVAALRQLIRQQPGLVEARLLLAAAYSAQGSPGDAIQIYQELEKAYPENPEVPLLLGATFLHQKQLADARTEFEKALQLAPNSLQALKQLVNLDLWEKQYSAAHQRVQASLKRNSSVPELHLLLGQVLAAQGETNQAEAAIARAIQLDPDYQIAYVMLAQIYTAAHRDQDALRELQAALAKNPKNGSVLTLMGMIYNSEKDYQKARDSYERLLAFNPNNALALNNLACVYADHLDQLDKATRLARQANDLAPSNPAIADTLGWILYRRGQYSAALSLLRESASKLQAEPEVQFHLAMTYYMLADEADAKAAFQRALQLNPSLSEKHECSRRLAVLTIDPKTAGVKTRTWLENWTAQHADDSIALVRLAAIYQRQGAADKAIAAYEAASKANPQNAAVMQSLAHLYASKDPRKALTWASAAYKLLPNNPEAAHLLGRLAFQTGDYKWALTLLQLTAQAQPQNPAALYDLGEAYYGMGKVPEARAAMQHALQNGADADQSEAAKRFLRMTALADQPARALAAQTQVDEILKSNPGYVPALMVQAAIASQKADVTAVELAYQEVLKHYPDFAPAQKQLAILYAKNPSNDARAYALAVKARAAFPHDPAVAKTLGILVYRQGDFNRAAGLLQDSARQMSRDPEVFYYLGMAQYQLKHRAESKTALQTALNLNLSGHQAASAKRLLAELK